MTQKYLHVTDTSATAECPKREHHVYLDGVLTGVTFEYGKPAVLPYELGAKFIQAGFIVKDADDNEVTLPSSAINALAEDEVIAKLSELTDDALKLRALARVGGEKFAVEEVDRFDLITFLMTQVPEEVEEDDAELEDEDGITADAQDNDTEAKLSEGLTGMVPQNAEDEIVVDVGGDEAPEDKEKAE